MVACLPVVIYSVLMSIIFEHYKQLHGLEENLIWERQEHLANLDNWSILTK